MRLHHHKRKSITFTVLLKTIRRIFRRVALPTGGAARKVITAPEKLVSNPKIS